MATLNIHLCEYCGKEFSRPRRRNPPIRFCSKSCTAYGTHHRHTCLQCDKIFLHKRDTVKFCSRPCRLRFARNEKEANRIPEPCKTCGTDLYHGRMKSHDEFCSKGCYYQSTYINRICKTCSVAFQLNRSGGWKKHKDFCSQSCRLNIHCELCYEPIYGRNRINGKPVRFCSRECAALHSSLEKVRVKYKILGYLATLERIGKIACEECDADDPYVLNVHHKDRNHANISRENLQTLCANCHVRTHRSTSKKTLHDAEQARRLFEQLQKRRHQHVQLQLL